MNTLVCDQCGHVWKTLLRVHSQPCSQEGCEGMLVLQNDGPGVGS